ncbi:5245_t:CDS:2, partial [Acaulospora morrowiae]
KITPSSVTPKNKTSSSTTILTRSTLPIRDLPECLRISHSIRSLTTSLQVDAIKLLQTNPSFLTIEAQSLLSQFSGDISSRLPFSYNGLLRVSDNTAFYRRGLRFGSNRRYFGLNNPIRFLNQRRLQLLEAEANAFPNDALKQAEFYKELIRTNNYNVIISRFERGKFAQDDECFQAYVTALARTGQTDKILPKLMQKLEQSTVDGTTRIIPTNDLVQNVIKGQGKKITVEGGPQTINSSAGNKENPIYVVIEEARGYMFWRALRWVGITFTYAFCILTFLSIAMENSGLLKTGGSQSEFEPSSQQVVKFSDVHG